MKRTLRYLKGTPKNGIVFTADSKCDLQSFCDSDYASDPFNRKSKSRMVFIVVLSYLYKLDFHRCDTVESKLLGNAYEWKALVNEYSRSKVKYLMIN